MDLMIQNFDHAILGIFHSLAESSGSFLTVLMKIISFSCEKGLIVIVAGIVLCIFKKTRKIGFCVLISLIIGVLLSNVILKNAVARPRPFDASEEYAVWWRYVGGDVLEDYSFPSGHATAAMAAVLSIVVMSKKKLTLIALLYPLAVGISRNYLMEHYPTDVLAGIIIGAIAAILAALIVKAILSALEKKGIDIV